MDRKLRTPADALHDPRPGDVSDTAPQPPPVPTNSEFTPKPGWLKRVFEQNSDFISRLPIEMKRAGGFEDIPDPREARIAALEAVIEADRTRIIDAVNALERVVNGKFWLTDGRGSYKWNDDRYREEFGEAVRSMLKAVEPLRKIGADLTNCPQTTAEVVKARADKDAKIAALEAQLAEERERLSMAVEALKESDRRIWEHHEVGHIERAAHRAWGKACEICSKESPTIFARNQAVLDATSASVAQHTASVERRGAIKELEKLATGNVSGVLEWAAARAEELRRQR